MPTKQTVSRVKAQPVAEELKKFEAYKYLRRIRGEQRNKGKREKAAKEAAEKV
jgi:hypothetical protein